MTDQTQGELAQRDAYTEAALERHKAEGMEWAVRARWMALAAIAVMLPIANPQWEVLYYEGLLVIFAINAWFQRRVARVGRSSAEMFFLNVDFFLMAFAILVPNPLSANDWPVAMEYRNGSYVYFFLLLASCTLAYSWRTIRGIGSIQATSWSLMAVGVWYFAEDRPELTLAINQAFAGDLALAAFLDPNRIHYFIRIQEVVVFAIVAYTLALTVRRFDRLLRSSAALERQRANLARYFSPNVVDELSHNDEPLKQIRSQSIAVLFVDIVGFTSFAANRSPEEVIQTLRDFHGRMGEAVFAHSGTLDKYLGDGLMATFGTPSPTDKDARNALSSVQEMMRSLDDWNRERAAKGEEEIRASFGLHYGPAVLGDIGAGRLEFAVIGNSINVASRIEAMTRNLETRLLVSDDFRNQAEKEGASEERAFENFKRHDGVSLRGLDHKVTLWSSA